MVFDNVVQILGITLDVFLLDLHHPKRRRGLLTALRQAGPVVLEILELPCGFVGLRDELISFANHGRETTPRDKLEFDANVGPSGSVLPHKILERFGLV